MNVQPLNIQLLLLNLHQLSRREHHLSQLEEEKIWERREARRRASLASDSRVPNALPGQQDQQNDERQGTVTTLTSARHHALSAHHPRFYDPMRGNIVDEQR